MQTWECQIMPMRDRHLEFTIHGSLMLSSKTLEDMLHECREQNMYIDIHTEMMGDNSIIFVALGELEKIFNHLTAYRGFTSNIASYSLLQARKDNLKRKESIL